MVIDRNKLDCILINAGMTRSELATKAGVALSTVLAASRRPAKIETLHKIITVLGVKAEDIMKEGECE